MTLLTNYLLTKTKVSISIVHLKLGFLNYDHRYIKYFKDRPQLKALLHHSRRVQKPTKTDVKLVSLADARNMYKTYKSSNCAVSLAAHVAFLLTLRSRSVVEPVFNITKSGDFYNVEISTKTTIRVIKVGAKLASRIKTLSRLSEQLSYSKLLNYMKETYKTNTHALRKSGASFLRLHFTEKEIKVFGHWQSRDICSDVYLRQQTLEKIALFLEEQI